MERKQKLTSDAMLVTTALIWGVAFVAQRVGMEDVGPFTFAAVRYLIATLGMIPVIAFSDWLGKKDKKEALPKSGKTLWLGGLFCGLALFSGATLQQIGLVYTSAGKAGFITALYIVIVPIFGLVLRKKMPKTIWICVALSVAGLYLLCIKENFTMNVGDIFVFIGSFFWAAHILVIDHFSPKVDGVRMSCIQFAVCMVLSFVLMALFEEPSLSAIVACAVPILYTALLSSCVAYTLQIIGQRHANPAVASLILSLEAVFAAIGGFVILHETMPAKEVVGCLMVFTAVIIAQLPQKSRAEN